MTDQTTTPPTCLGCVGCGGPDCIGRTWPEPKSTTDPLDIRSAQKLAWDNKLAKGFNTTDVSLEFGLLTAEIGEAFTAWRKGLSDFGEELADVFLYLVAIAEMTGLDLADEVVGKIEKNAGRRYERNENGAFIRVGEQP